MKNKEAIKYLENMKWLKGYDNTTIGDIPLTDIIDQIIMLLQKQEDTIEQLERDLAITENNLHYYMNGND